MTIMDQEVELIENMELKEDDEELEEDEVQDLNSILAQITIDIRNATEMLRLEQESRRRPIAPPSPELSPRTFSFVPLVPDEELPEILRSGKEITLIMDPPEIDPELQNKIPFGPMTYSEFCKSERKETTENASSEENVIVTPQGNVPMGTVDIQDPEDFESSDDEEYYAMRPNPKRMKFGPSFDPRYEP